MNGQDDFYDNISDNEIRVIGSTQNLQQKVSSDEKKPQRQYWWKIILAVVAAIGIAVCCWTFFLGNEPKTPSDDCGKMESYETVTMDTVAVDAGAPAPAFCEEYVDSVNDICLHIVTPVGCMPELHLGKLPDDKGAFVMAVQAADVRGDNGEIAGAYIYRGELKSKGRSKLGYCAIIGNELTLGRQVETPLFERAIEENGYFFRQYSLVNEGKMIDIKPKGKSLRRALCYFKGKIVIIESVERESYHDFSQALADLGVEEAIALIGGDALFMYVTEDGKVCLKGKELAEQYKNINYIVWK